MQSEAMTWLNHATTVIIIAGAMIAVFTCTKIIA